jgi:glycosyltransferase involved in cell wall biosynthesis
MKLACVVHRYGGDIAGGSEAHCRAVAQQLAARHDVTILTTCARDHVTWRNHYPPGESTDGPLRVHRFAVSRERSLHRFAELSDLAFDAGAHSADEDAWFKANGPDAPALLEFLRTQGRDYDLVMFWAFRYATTRFGLPPVADRAVLVPTAEDDPVIRFSASAQLFAAPRGLVFLTPEEEMLVARHCRQPLPPAVTIGTGIEPAPPQAAAVPPPLGLSGAFVLYLGRVDPNKGCETLLRHYLRWAEQSDLQAPLVLAGPVNMPLPDHPLIRPLGYVEPAVRDALLAHTSALIVPSPYESLSIVLLEAWNRATPALINGRCDVLRGQALRSDGALYYRDYDEFARALDYLLRHPDVARQLGRNGLAYVDREYRWPHVTAKLETFLASL